MWRRHVQKVSKAEEQIFAEVCRRGLNRGLSTQEPFEFNGAVEGVEGTFVDFLWNYYRPLAVFIDGMHLHLKKKQEIKDELIDEALQRRGYKVVRFKYKPPLTKHRLKEICDGIEALLLWKSDDEVV